MREEIKIKRKKKKMEKLISLLNKIGLQSIGDLGSIISEGFIETVDLEELREIMHLHSIDHKLLEDTSESKFNCLNMILMLRYGVFIDEIKEVDGLEAKGYKLEIVPF